MSKRVTIQEIADSLGISRNTVSKAINNSPGLSEATRVKILQRATEMGYKQFSYLNATSQSWLKGAESAQPPLQDADAPTREIAFFSIRFLGGTHFALPMLDQFQLELSQQGYALTMHRISAQELAERRLPITFQRSRTSAILCAELLDRDYAQMLTQVGLPLVMVDAPVFTSGTKLACDLLLMENTASIDAFLGEMLTRGVQEAGFIGHAVHCRSFFERYMAFRSTMTLHGLPIREEYCLTDTWQNQEYPRSEDYRAYLKEQLSALDRLPQLFLCANDYVAMDTLQTFKELGISCPRDVMLCGFDDAPKSAYLTPSLTTVRIRSKDIGTAAVELLLSRIRRPNMAFRTVYVESDLIWRESAPGKGSVT